MRTRNSPAVDAAFAWILFASMLFGGVGAMALLTDLHPAVPIVCAFGTIATGAGSAALRDYVNRRTAPLEDVLEIRSDPAAEIRSNPAARRAVVVAGPAADRVTPGDVIRPYDEPVR